MVGEGDGVLAKPEGAPLLRVGLDWTRVAWREGKGKERYRTRSLLGRVDGVRVGGGWALIGGLKWWR
jgi:hypothetical protein